MNDKKIHLQDTPFWIPAEKKVWCMRVYMFGKQIQLSVKQRNCYGTK